MIITVGYIYYIQQVEIIIGENDERFLAFSAFFLPQARTLVLITEVESCTVLVRIDTFAIETNTAFKR